MTSPYEEWRANPTSILSHPSIRHYGTVIILSLLAGVTCYGLLPAVGLESMAGRFGIEKIWMGLTLLIGGIGYLLFFLKTQRKPLILFYLACLLLPLYIYGMGILKDIGIPIRLIAFLFGTITLPAIILMRQSFGFLWRVTPHFRYYSMFLGVVLLFFIFNNAQAVDYRYLKEASAYIPLSNSHLSALSLMYSSQIITGATFLAARNKSAFFKHATITILGLLALYGFSALCFYPLKILTVSLADGIPREGHIFGHPNLFSHYSGIFMLYALGMYFYYQSRRQLSNSASLAFKGILGLTLLSLLTGLSKTAILSAVAAGLGMLLLQQRTTPKSRNTQSKPMLRFWIAGILLIPFIAILFQSTGLLDLLGNRFSSNSSLDWRVDQWAKLVQDSTPASILFGHGFTAAVIKIEQLTYNVFRIAQGTTESPYVHNIFIEHFYDFGLIGFLWVIGLLMLIKDSIATLSKSVFTPGEKPLAITILGITFFFITGCLFDEMFYSTVYPYWFLITLVWLMKWYTGVRHEPEV